MTRRCSHCCANGHNSRTCPGRSSGSGGGGGAGGVRLFGVRLTEAGAMKKSASMGCLSHYCHSSSPSLSPAASAQASPSGGGGTNTTNNLEAGGDDGPDPSGGRDPGRASGYASDDPSRASCSSGCRSERKKGTPWTEEEHRKFLLGLQRLGKGDWRGIARNFVVSRTPTQVASHAQKYFIRQSNSSRRKRRASLFDMAPDMPMDQDQIPIVEEQQMLLFPSDQESPTAQKLLLPSLNSTPDEESATAEVVMETPGPDAEESNTISSSNSSLSLHPMVPAFYPAFIPLPVNFWSATVITTSVEEEGAMSKEAPKVLKPTPILPETTVHVDELVGLSNLTLGERASTLSECIEPSVLSSKLLSASASGNSAFHPNPVVAARADLNRSNGNTVIHAV